VAFGIAETSESCSEREKKSLSPQIINVGVLIFFNATPASGDIISVMISRHTCAGNFMLSFKTVRKNSFESG
jgi:hypothetical protein